MRLVPGFSDWDKPQADAARDRLKQRNSRLARQLEASEKKLEDKALGKPSEIDEHETLSGEANKKRALIAAALERARARRKTADQSVVPFGESD
jgi:hypothetical protein